MGEQRRELVDGVPLCWRSPSNPSAIAIHVPAFGQTKEQAIGVVEFLSDRGFASVVIDAFQHGERGHEDRETINRRVFENFRRSMWTIIGMTALDLPSVGDWARGRFGSGLPLHLTGLSMGGDTVLAAAPLMDNVASVNAVIATPDWTRPGMRDIATDALIQQGSPDQRAKVLYEALDPISHPARYQELTIRFILGEKDRHVPAEASYRFSERVNAAARQRRVTVLEKPGLNHLDFVKIDWWKDLSFGSQQ